MTLSPNSEKCYREIDVELVRRMVEPLEGEILAARRVADPTADEAQLEERLADVMESLIFDTLDAHPSFSRFVDDLEKRCKGKGVSLYRAR